MSASWTGKALYLTHSTFNYNITRVKCIHVSFSPLCKTLSLSQVRPKRLLTLQVVTSKFSDEQKLEASLKDAVHSKIGMHTLRVLKCSRAAKGKNTVMHTESKRNKTNITFYYFHTQPLPLSNIYRLLSMKLL